MLLAAKWQTYVKTTTTTEQHSMIGSKAQSKCSSKSFHQSHRHQQPTKSHQQIFNGEHGDGSGYKQNGRERESVAVGSLGRLTAQQANV